MSYNYNIFSKKYFNDLVQSSDNTNSYFDFVKGLDAYKKINGDDEPDASRIDDIFTPAPSALNDIELDVILNMHRSPINNPGLFVGMHIHEVTKEMYDAYPDYKLHINNVNIDAICHSSFSSSRLNMIVDVHTNIIKAIFFG